MLSFIISKEELQKMIKLNNENLVIIDLRDEDKYKQYHIDKAINYSYELLMKSSFFCDKITRDKEIVLYCDRGGRSIYATRKLRNMGYNAASLLGGLDNYM